MSRPGASLGPLVLLSLLAAGPARAGGFKCPEAGGPPWREVRTAHFVIRTDLSSGKARDLAEELERVHEAVRYGLFSPSPPETGVLRVLALADKDEYDLFAPTKDAAAHYADSVFSGPVIVMYGVGAISQRILLAHEITHHVAARAFAREPPWFTEGLACFMESVATPGTPTYGGVPEHRVRGVYPYHGSVARVLRARHALDTGRDYSVAWALVHYLMNRHPEQLLELERRFGRGQDPDAAWREVFPQWNPASDEAMEALDTEIGRYIAHGQFRYRDIKLPPAEPPTERPMSAAEAHDARLSVHWWNRGEKVEAGRLEAEVQEALRHDPGCVSALAVIIARKPAEAEALARRATAAHPGDPRAWLLLARGLPPEATEEREAALRKAVAADPSNATALNDLAWHLLQAGRTDEAFPLARRAVQLEPGWAPLLDTLAGVVEARGDCATALAVQRRAIDLLPEKMPEPRRAPYRERLTRLGKACGGPRPSPAAPASAAKEGRAAGAESARPDGSGERTVPR